MRNTYLIVLAIISFSTAIMAQPKLKFEKERHDFGQVAEENGAVEYSFLFVNEGNEPLKIQKVKASCGCTTPAWTREQILPGDSGFIMARYNPRNRPGRFNKSLRLTTTPAIQNKVLYISGIVKPKPKSLEEAFPLLIGGLRFKSRYINLGKVTTEKKASKKVNILNLGDSTIFLKNESIIAPDYIQVAIDGDSLAPGKEGLLTINFDPVEKNDYGYVTDQIQWGNSSLSIVATIEEYFPELTPEELDKAPRLSINDRSFKFEELKSGDKLSMKFELTNSGGRKLLIRKIKSNCSCLTYESIRSKVAKGKKVELNAVLDTQDLRGNQHKTLSIFTNDPIAPSQVITIKGKVSAN